MEEQAHLGGQLIGDEFPPGQIRWEDRPHLYRPTVCHTGTDFSLTAPIGESGDNVFKEQSIIEEKVYRDTWGSGLDSYLAMMADTIEADQNPIVP